jgi:hypothetical protein
MINNNFEDTDVFSIINECNGEEGMKTLVKIQGLWSSISKSDKMRSKVLKSIKNRLEKIGF